MKTTTGTRKRLINQTPAIIKNLVFIFSFIFLFSSFLLADDPRIVSYSMSPSNPGYGEFFHVDLTVCIGEYVNTPRLLIAISSRSERVFSGMAGQIFLSGDAHFSNTVTAARVGIGNTNPTVALDVTGDVLVSGSSVFSGLLTVGNNIAFTTNYEKGSNINADGKPVEVSIRATNTFRKEDGKWKMIGHHTDLLPFLQK